MSEFYPDDEVVILYTKQDMADVMSRAVTDEEVDIVKNAWQWSSIPEAWGEVVHSALTNHRVKPDGI